MGTQKDTNACEVRDPMGQHLCSKWAFRSIVLLCIVPGAAACGKSLQDVPVGECANWVLVPKNPMSTGPRPRRLIVLREDDWRQFVRRFVPSSDMESGLPPHGAPSVARCLHILRLRGFGAEFEAGYFSDGGKMIEHILNEKTASLLYSGRISRTRYGARFPMLGTGETLAESHPYQLLAELSDAGVPLRRSFTVEGQAMQVRDLLSDCLSNFRLADRQIEWPLIAAANYLPPARKWRSKHGEEVSFDLAVRELLRRDLVRQPCGGTHLFYAMVKIARAAEVYSILGKSQRDALYDRLRDLVESACVNQAGEGAWGHRWHDRNSEVGRVSLVITGHLAEFMLYLPESLQPPDDVLAAAARWLWDQVHSVGEGGRIGDNICPLTHAACFLRDVRRVP